MMKEFLLQYDKYQKSNRALLPLFDLQFFAAEDEGRTEDPTEKKIREARDKGQVARSQEFPQAFVVIIGMLVVFGMGKWIYDSLAKITVYYYSHFSRMYITPRGVASDFFLILTEFAKILLPIFTATIVAALVSNIAQVGFKFSSHPLKPDIKKLKFDPATIMKKVFFSKQIAMNLFKSIFKIVVIGVAAYLIITNDFETILLAPDLSVQAAFKNILIVGLKIIIWSSVLLLILSVPDYIFQRYEFKESLKMTKQEVKEELRETMGDPYQKARLREMQRDILMKNMVNEVPKADVIVTNPTHYAVALHYESTTMEAPTVLAKGVDNIALRIRQIAREHNITMIENRSLARKMYDELEVGQEVPPELFYAVSVVYAQLYRQDNVQQAI